MAPNGVPHARREIGRHIVAAGGHRHRDADWTACPSASRACRSPSGEVAPHQYKPIQDASVPNETALPVQAQLPAPPTGPGRRPHQAAYSRTAASSSQRASRRSAPNCSRSPTFAFSSAACST